jgi:hypothetical protein
LISLNFISMPLAWLIVPVSIAAFLVVWLCSHAINVLIIMSPFSLVDSLLKLMRGALLLMIGAVYFIAPWLAVVMCIAIIFVAAWLAPAAFRLAIFGVRFSGDILFPWWRKDQTTPQNPHAFTLGKLAGLPPRTGGRLVLLDDGTAVFRYRRWCLLNERTIPLPDGRCHVERGLLSPALKQSIGEREMKLLLFLPRYRGHEESMVAHLKFHGVRDHAVIRSFSALRGWLREMISGKREREPS